ncbi:hypothetical protein JCM16303_002680 [Sporobolomyces ruberrimus]
MTSTVTPRQAPPTSSSNATTTRLKRTSGWFSSAKANLRSIGSSSTNQGVGGGGGVNSSSPPATTNKATTTPPESKLERSNTSTSTATAKPGGGLKRNGSLRSSFGSSTREKPNMAMNLTIKTTNLIKEEETPTWASTGSTPGQRIIGAVQDEWPLYSCRAKDYTILEPIGFGASSVVHLATYTPLGSKSPLSCAVKIIDVDRLSSVGDIDRLRRETQLMALSKHPNVLRVRGEWIEGSKLFIAVRYMTHGSLLDISRYAFQEGFDEPVIATVLQQALHGLLYLHQNGWLHRDIKAANLLVDDDGTVLLADFGVSSSLFQETAAATKSTRKGEEAEEEDRSSPFAARKSFVGTPCWIAPEVIERKSYDSKADVWSFGITALELASGRAPNSLYPPAKALSKTILDDSPELDRDGGKYKYSKNFKEMVDSCLQKDPKKRPTAEKLLQHPFFKSAKKKSYLVSAILEDLPPVQDRQQRRRKNSMGRADTMASWDFNPTQPSTPMSARRPSASDPFASFSTTNSPYNTLPSRSLSSLPGSPSSDHPLPHQRDSRSLALSALGPNFYQGSQQRRRDPSRASQSSLGGGGHRRNISFDFDTTSNPPSSPPTRTRDLSIGGGSVHFKEDEKEDKLEVEQVKVEPKEGEE